MLTRESILTESRFCAVESAERIVVACSRARVVFEQEVVSRCCAGKAVTGVVKSDNKAMICKASIGIRSGIMAQKNS